MPYHYSFYHKALWRQLALMVNDECRNLRWRKEWICSESPITICARVKGWICQGSRIWHQGEVTREQGPIRALIIYITEKPMRQHHLSMLRAQIVGYLLRLTCSGWPAGFISTCFIHLRQKYISYLGRQICLKWFGNYGFLYETAAILAGDLSARCLEACY